MLIINLANLWGFSGLSRLFLELTFEQNVIIVTFYFILIFKKLFRKLFMINYEDHDQ